MRIAVIDSSDTMPKTTVNVHLTNAIEISKHLQDKGHSVDLFVSNSKMDSKRQYDVILMNYASMYFDFKKFSVLFDNQKNCKIGWVTNDYNLAPNSSLVKYMQFLITNHSRSHLKTWADIPECVVNLNSLIMKKNIYEPKWKYGCIYYGTFRQHREKYFQKYFKDKGMYVSTSNKNIKKYKNIDCDAIFLNKLDWRFGKETLRLFKYSLYIEDEPTHNWFSFLANRFYESLNCNNMILFDKSCLNTINKSIYDKNDLIMVDSLEDIQRIDMSKEDILLKIRKNTELAMHEKEKCLKQISEFIGA